MMVGVVWFMFMMMKMMRIMSKVKFKKWLKLKYVEKYVFFVGGQKKIVGYVWLFKKKMYKKNIVCGFECFKINLNI